MVSENIRRFIVQSAARYPGIERVVLFGSRAREDAGECSDFDFAVIAPDLSHTTWSRFVQDLQEQFPSLCKLDLVLITPSSSEALRNKIQQEGIVFYDRAA